MRLGRVSSINEKKGTASVVFIQSQVTSVHLPILSYLIPKLKINDVVLVADTEDEYSVVLGKIFSDEYTPQDYKDEHEEFYKKVFKEIANSTCNNYEVKG